MANYDTLKTTIASRIPDNTDQLISAADVRNSFEDTLDEVNATKQDKLVSGSNIKTINGNDVLGSGDITIQGSSDAEWGDITGDINDQTDLKSALDAKQNTISDLNTIRSGAAAGATAVQPGELATVATTGDYNDLSNRPSIPAAQVQSNWDEADTTSKAYIQNKPTIPAAQIQSDWTQVDNTKKDYIKNKPSLAAVATSGDYADLSNKPSIPAAQVNSDWNANSGVAEILNKPSLATVATSGNYNDLSNKPTIPAAQVQSDWDEVDTTSKAYIQNKPAIPAAPGTLDTTATTAQTTNASEALSGSVTLHKVSKTGTYSDLIGLPALPPGTYIGTGTSWSSNASQCALRTSYFAGGVIPTKEGDLVYSTSTRNLHRCGAITWDSGMNAYKTTPTFVANFALPPTISTDIATDKADDTKTASPKAVYDFVKPAMASSQPAGGMEPGVLYNLGTLSGSVTISFAAASDANVENEYKFTFDTGASAPTITWPNSITGWAGNCLDNSAPLIAASKHYEVSVIGAYGIIAEF